MKEQAMKRLFAALIALSVLGGGVAFAQDAGAPAPKVEYKKKTSYDFEDDVVEGELVKPEGDFVGVRTRSKHSSLIKIRQDFVQEMVKSVNDI
jgi:hypothetical protein